MKITVLAVGRIRTPFADAQAHYLKLLGPHARVEVVEVPEEAKLAKRIPERAHVCLLDERGTQRSSQEWAGWLEQRRMSGRDLCLVVGGAFGTSLEHVDETISFGRMTLPFQLARVVALEQLFRAHKILAGEPYHH